MKKLALTSAMVLFLGCATAPQIKPEVEVATSVHNLFMGYTDITDDTKLANIEPNEVILTVDIPEGKKTAICFVQLSCPKGTTIKAVWFFNGKEFVTAKLEAPVNLMQHMVRFWYARPDSLISGEWQIDILLSDTKLETVMFTVQ